MTVDWGEEKKLRDSTVAANEARWKSAQATKDRASHVVARMGKKGKKTIPDPRGWPHWDEQILLCIRAAIKAERTVRLTNHSGAGVLRPGYQKPPFEMMAKRKRKSTSAPIFWSKAKIDGISGDVCINVPDWKRTGERMKAFAWAMALEGTTSQPTAFTLNLGPEVIALARSQESGGRGFARTLRDRISFQLRASLHEFDLDVPAYFFVVEARKRELSHVHGALGLPTGEQAAQVRKAIRGALKTAGGLWNPSKPENQLRLSDVYNAAGWAAYVSKWLFTTRIILQDHNRCAATKQLRAAAKLWYEEARKASQVIYRPAR